MAAGALPSPRAGFTLLETLLAVVIGGMLLVSAVAFALSMSELWGSGSETRLFDQHVRGVSRFLENLLRQAEPAPPPSDEGGTRQQAQAAQETQRARQSGIVVDTSEAPVSWQEPRGRSLAGEPLLTFQLAESPGVFAWPERPLPFVVCALRVDPREGLFLLWKSRLELDFEDEAPREMRVSPFVTGISYFYYNTTGPTPVWEESPDPRTAADRTPETPQRVRLTFEYKGDERSVDLVIPGAATAAPVY